MTDHYDREPGDDPGHGKETRVTYGHYKQYIQEAFYTIEEVERILKIMRKAEALLKAANEKSMRKIP